MNDDVKETLKVRGSYWWGIFIAGISIRLIVSAISEIRKEES